MDNKVNKIKLLNELKLSVELLKEGLFHVQAALELWTDLYDTERLDDTEPVEDLTGREEADEYA